MTGDALESLRRSVQSLSAELVNVYEELTLLHSLQRLGKKTGIASACIGGGQGIALLVEAA